MKACVIEKYGPPEVLEIREVKTPTINDDQLLIENVATSVNPVDWKIRSGALKILTGKKFPKILGGDFAGKVVKIGKEIRDFKVGDEVYGALDAFKGKAYAEYVVATPNQIALKPFELSFVEAASLPIAGLTALQSLTSIGKIKEGDRVFINGCTGGVGAFAVQIAKAKGAHVTGTCSNKNIDFAKKLGTDIILNYKEQDFLKAYDTYDIFFDVAAKLSYLKTRPLLKKKGSYITTIPCATTLLFGWLINLVSQKKNRSIRMKPTKQDLEALNNLIDQGNIKPIVSNQFPIEQMTQAHTLCEAGTTTGKISVSIKS